MARFSRLDVYQRLLDEGVLAERRLADGRLGRRAHLGSTGGNGQASGAAADNDDISGNFIRHF